MISVKEKNDLKVEHDNKVSELTQLIDTLTVELSSCNDQLTILKQQRQAIDELKRDDIVEVEGVDISHIHHEGEDIARQTDRGIDKQVIRDTVRQADGREDPKEEIDDMASTIESGVIVSIPSTSSHSQDVDSSPDMDSNEERKMKLLIEQLSNEVSILVSPYHYLLNCLICQLMEVKEKNSILQSELQKISHKLPSSSRIVRQLETEVDKVLDDDMTEIRYGETYEMNIKSLQTKLLQAELKISNLDDERIRLEGELQNLERLIANNSTNDLMPSPG